MKLSDILRTRSTVFVGYLLLVATPALILGFAGYFGIIAPLKGKLLAEQTRSLGTGIDATIGERANCLAVAFGEDEPEDFLEESRLQDIVRSIRTRFPDFISLEMIDSSGTILAMAGDVAISPENGVEDAAVKEMAGRFPKALKKAWTFYDDPAGEHFSVTWGRPGNGTALFFVRARFSRKPIRDLLEAASKEIDGVVGFVQVADSGVGKWHDAAGSGSRNDAGIVPAASSPVAVSGKWFSAPTRTEMRLSVPGWAVTLEGNPKGIFSTGQIVSTGAAALLALLLVTATMLRPVQPPPAVESERQAALDEPAEPADSAQDSLVREKAHPAEHADYFASAPYVWEENAPESCADTDDALTVTAADEVPDAAERFGDDPGPEADSNASAELFGQESEHQAAVLDDDFLGWHPEALGELHVDTREELTGGVAGPHWHIDQSGMDLGGSSGEPADMWTVEPGVFTAVNEKPSDDYSAPNTNLQSGETDPVGVDDEEFLLVSWEEPSLDDQPDSSSGPSHTRLP